MGLSKLAFLLAKKPKRIIYSNLDLVYGNSLSQKEKETIAKECFNMMLMNLLSLIENPVNSKEDMRKKVEFENMEILRQLEAKGIPVILVSAHYSNLEALAYFMGQYVVQTVHIARKVNNEYFNDFLMKHRNATGLHIVDKDGAVKHLLKAMKNKQAVSLIVDQNTTDKDGILIDFMGKRARQTDTPAFLARKFDAAIVPFFIHSKDYRNYKIVFHEPIFCDKTEDKDADILKATQAQADVISQVIYDNPKYWFWCHKRWKNQYEYIYE